MERPAETSSTRRPAPAVLALLGALVVAWSYLIQPSGDNQNAHYALVRALADGRATVDHIVGTEQATGDVVLFEGHLYAAKAPGLALFSLPVYLVADAAGIRTDGDPAEIEWLLHLWGAVLPAAVLVLLVLAIGRRIDAAGAVVAAGVLGLATLVLPFGTLFFAHVLATCLAFAAFFLVRREREGPPRPALLALAGLLAGLGVTTDYPAALVAALVGLYVLTRRERLLPRALAYGAGVFAGCLPLFLYNRWAFGSALHFPYEGWHAPGGAQHPGVFGVSSPSLHRALDLVLVPAGLAMLAPAVIGLVLLRRRGLGTEALLIAMTVLGFVLYNSGFVDPFGGASPGPRYLIPVLPFLAVALVPAVRALPGPVLGLAAGATIVLAVYTATTPLAAWDGHAFDRLRAGSVVPTVASFVGVTGAYAVLPFFAAVAAAAVLALRAARLPRLDQRELVRGAAALGAWTLVVWQAPKLLVGRELQDSAAALLLVAAAVGAVATLYVGRYGRRALGRPADERPSTG